MESSETRMIALVNRLADAFYPDPEDPGPIGPWGPWIREAMRAGPFPQPWKYGPLPDPWGGPGLAANSDDDWWKDYHPGPRPWLALLAALTGHVDDRDRPFGGDRPRPNWALRAMLRDLASLNPQPLPPVDPTLVFARRLAYVALRRANDAGGENGSDLLRRFVAGWCGNEIPVPRLPDPVPDEPRPPRPEESLVLGATMVRAAGSAEFIGVKEAGEAAGREIFAHGASGRM